MNIYLSINLQSNTDEIWLVYDNTAGLIRYSLMLFLDIRIWYIYNIDFQMLMHSQPILAGLMENASAVYSEGFGSNHTIDKIFFPFVIIFASCSSHLDWVCAYDIKHDIYPR